jgi:sugar lactone lactonase YvrE
MLRFISLLAGASIALAQQYSISTVAGGAPPATPAAAASVSLGQPGRVALDAAGNLYVSSSNCVFKIASTGTVTLIAGTSRAGFSGDGGLAVNAQLNSPQGMAFDPNGNMYIADSRNNRIRQVSTSGIITTFAGNGTVSPGGGPSAYGDGGPATSAQLHLPMGVAVDQYFNVYIADTGDNTIRQVTADGNIATIAGDSFPSYQGDAGLAIAAELHNPEDVAVDSSGNIYIADTANAYIRKVTTDGNINYIAGDGSIGYSGDGGYATSADLIAPFALVVDSSGNVYFAENGDSRIRRIDAKSLDISTVAGNGTNGFSGDGSTAINAEMNSPTGLALDSAGNLYIADSLNCRIRKVTSGGNISTIVGNGTLSYSGDGGLASQAQLNAPQGVAADAAGNLYVADTLNNVVRKVSPNGTIANFAGNGGVGSSGDGSAATSAQLHGPQGLAVDASGNVFIADTLNAKVRKVSASGIISTVAGSGTPGYGGDGGAAASAQLNLPIGVAVDSSGNL